MGLFADENAISLETLIIDHEVTGWIKRVLQGITVNADTTDLSVFKEVGPGGDFVSALHTMENFKKEMFLPGCMDRGFLRLDKDPEEKSMRKRARKFFTKAMAGYTPPDLPEDIESNLWNTTTDIAFIDKGRPRLNTEGALIGGRRTLVEAVDVYTVGRGGVSLVDFSRDNNLTIGPKRVVLLSLLGVDHPEILKTLRRQRAADIWENGMSQFLVSGRSLNNRIGNEELAILEAIKAAPVSLQAKVNDRDGFFRRTAIQRVEEELLLAILEKVVDSPDPQPPEAKQDLAFYLSEWQKRDAETRELDCTLTLRRPIITIGAPVKSYMKPVAKNLNTNLIIPEHAEVANAVGAVCGGIVQRRRVIIGAIDGAQEFRAHLPDGVHDFLDLEEAVSYVHRTMSLYMKALAEKAGIEKVAVQMKRLDHTGRFVAGSNESIFLDTELVFTAAGRPAC
jgi:N-methylhydantoinase A/oxoprolinase/acetone carboxylase beta subunit